MADERPLLPDYEGACITNIVPALLEPGQAWPTWFPDAAEDADQVVLLVLDGLGWNQLEARRRLAPTICRAGGRVDHHGRAVHHGRGAHLDLHRAAARRRTASSATG